jgi:hypothetical protein
MPARLKRAQPAEPDSLESLAPLLDEHLPALFTAAQHTTASHRKHINTLHSVFLRCAKVTTLSADGRFTRLSGEKAFGEKFREMVTHPLGVKKGADQGDRVIKFVAGFVGFAVEYGASRLSLEPLSFCPHVRRRSADARNSQTSSSARRMEPKTTKRTRMALPLVSLPSFSPSSSVASRPRTRLRGTDASSWSRL